MKVKLWKNILGRLCPGLIIALVFLAVPKAYGQSPASPAGILAVNSNYIQ